MPKDCSALVWIVFHTTQEDHDNNRCVNFGPPPLEMNGKLARFTMAFPREDNLNPLKWCDSSGMPIGYQEKVAHYAWISKGTK